MALNRLQIDRLLEDQLFSNKKPSFYLIMYIYVTDSLPHSQDVQLFWPLFVDRFGRSLQFSHLEFDGFIAHSRSTKWSLTASL